MMFLYLKLCLQMIFLLLARYAFGFKTQEFGNIILEHHESLKVFIKYLNKIQSVLYEIKHKKCYGTLQGCQPCMYKHTDNSLSLSDKLQVRLYSPAIPHCNQDTLTSQFLTSYKASENKQRCMTSCPTVPETELIYKM